jgi:hypothetical protein
MQRRAWLGVYNGYFLMCFFIYKFIKILFFVSKQYKIIKNNLKFNLIFLKYKDKQILKLYSSRYAVVLKITWLRRLLRLLLLLLLLLLFLPL